MNAPRYAELHCLSNFSFQRGASSARKLFERAAAQDYAALAITDECSLAGIVRAWEASKATGVALIVGTEVRLADGPKLVLLAADHTGYSDLCRLITTARRRCPKGQYHALRGDIETLAAGVLALWIPACTSTHATAESKTHTGIKTPAPSATPADDDEHAAWLARHFRDRVWIAVELHHGSDDAAVITRLRALGARHALPLVAAGDVHMHARRRRALQNALTAIGLNCTITAAGRRLFANGERHLRRIAALAALYPPDLLAETLAIAARCRFTLAGLNYQYPHELVLPGHTAASHLRALTLAGAAVRWPRGVAAAVRTQIDKELALIATLQYEHFFLTVHDIVAWARAQTPPILCQGRGSSANSAVCYCLGITAVDPEHGNLLFERFLSKERKQPPDIDVDFEHERREEVLQYVFNKYGRDRAALAATVICYRRKSAVRDIARVLGLADDQIDQLNRAWALGDDEETLAAGLRERGFDPDSRVMRQLVALVRELRGFPRHLSQHVGGFVISEQPLHHLVPVENAAMADRTIIQWDKDDLESLGLLKVDCLGLGMLTCLRKCFDLLRAHGGPDLDLYSVPQDDAPTYDMICAADTVGVFQIESRAQMSMLARLRPRTFYDLVIEVAIVRPGPIQGDMVHPYLRRRHGLEAIDYPQSRAERECGDGRSRVKSTLQRTLGIPIFQEQVMKLVEVVADFTSGEADQLRRAMAAWKRRGGLEPFRDKIRAGMLANGYEESYFERIFEQIKGFGEYGFPESHSAGFALIAYVSSWLKCHHPAAFACALINSQPMGFYQPAQIVQDVQRHNIGVRAADVAISAWDCTLERDDDAQPALRLGLRLIKGLAESAAQRIVVARGEKAFRDVADLVRRAALNASERAHLADAGALQTLSGHRHRARWDSAGAETPVPVFADAVLREQAVTLRAPSLREDVMSDYATIGLSLARHPIALIRSELRRRRIVSASELLRDGNNGRRLRCAGLVTVRQHPGTARGVTFVTLEDETGQVNVVVWRALAERQYRALAESTVMGVAGTVQISEGVCHLIAERLSDLSHLVPELAFTSHDFH